jgi:hypothetical protein
VDARRQSGFITPHFEGKGRLTVACVELGPHALNGRRDHVERLVTLYEFHVETFLFSCAQLLPASQSSRSNLLTGAGWHRRGCGKAPTRHPPDLQKTIGERETCRANATMTRTDEIAYVDAATTFTARGTCG